MKFRPTRNLFTVQSATAITRATGTQFSIEAQPTETEIVLTNGQVTVLSAQLESPPVTLSPGERSRVLLGESPSLPEPVSDMTDQLSWTGLFIFHNSPLAEVTSHLGSHFDADINVAESLEQERFKASFDPDTLTLNEALETLSIAFDAKIDTLSNEANAYLLSPFVGE